METILILTKNTSGILGPIATLMGYVINWIYLFLDKVLNIQNVSITIILFTVVIYICMIPLTFKQQKFSKMSQLMNPEIQKVQKKYKNKKDQYSMEKMNEETQAIYRKYGVNPSGSCVFMIIQLVILFPLYRVIRNVPAYVPSIKSAFTSLVSAVTSQSGYETIMENFYETVSSENSSIYSNISLDFTDATTTSDSLIDVFYRLTDNHWDLLRETFSGITDVIDSTQTVVAKFNYFLGISINYSPKAIINNAIGDKNWIGLLVAILVPFFAMAFQFLNVRLAPTNNSGDTDQNSMANQMKMMNYMMPVYSFAIVFFLPVGIGIYWSTGAIIRCIQQVVINKYFDRMDIEAYLEKNQAKAAAKEKKKIEKKGVSGDKITSAANINTRSISKPKTMSEKAASVSKKDIDTGTKKYKEGSMADKANRVKNYNEKNTKSSKK